MTPNPTDLARLEAKVDAMALQVASLAETQRMLSDLYRTLMPIATLALGSAQTRLGELEKKGYFDFGRELLHLLDRVVTSYTPDDVHQLADNVVRILDVVRTVTRPEALDFAEQVAHAAEDAADHKATGVLGLLHATNSDDDVRRGLAVVLEGLRQVGRGSRGATTAAAHAPRVNPLLGAKRNLGPSATRHAAPHPHAREGHEAAPHHAPGAGAHPAGPAPAGARSPTSHPTAPAVAPASTLSGVLLDADGFLADPSAWTPALAEELARESGLSPLSERHWTVLNFVRADFLEKKASPNIRRITTGAGVQTKELYTLFPRAPAKTAARIAGTKKPVGCV